jgi:hypothetical protein
MVLIVDLDGYEQVKAYTGPKPLIKQQDIVPLIERLETRQEYVECFNYQKNYGYIGIKVLYRPSGEKYGYGLYCRYNTKQSWYINKSERSHYEKGHTSSIVDR